MGSNRGDLVGSRPTSAANYGQILTEGVIMYLPIIFLLAYMMNSEVKQRWHDCEFPHSWDKEIEHIIDTGLATIHVT